MRQNKQIEVELRIPEELLERGAVNIPGREDQAAVELYARLAAGPALLWGKDVAVHLLALDRRADETAVRTERPTVIDAAVHLRACRPRPSHTRMPRCVHMFSSTWTSPVRSRETMTWSSPMSRTTKSPEFGISVSCPSSSQVLPKMRSISSLVDLVVREQTHRHFARLRVDELVDGACRPIAWAWIR